MLPKINDKLLTRNGMVYFLAELHKRYWLIRAKNKTTDQIHWEVWKIQKSSGAFSNKWGVKFPSSEQFGTLGWCFQHQENALKKMQELLEKHNLWEKNTKI